MEAFPLNQTTYSWVFTWIPFQLATLVLGHWGLLPPSCLAALNMLVFSIARLGPSQLIITPDSAVLWPQLLTAPPPLFFQVNFETFISHLLPSRY